MDIYDRALKRGDLREMMGFTGWQADCFMAKYGTPTGAGRERAIRQSEVRMMQLDGRMAEFVKTFKTDEEIKAWRGR